MRHFVHNSLKQYKSLLPWIEYWYNTTYYSSTSMSPFRHFKVVSVNHYLVKRLVQHMFINKHQTLIKWRDIFFWCWRLGSLIVSMRFFTTHPWSYPWDSLSLSDWSSSGDVAYRLVLAKSTRFHNVFHVSLQETCGLWYSYIGETSTSACQWVTPSQAKTSATSSGQ